MRRAQTAWARRNSRQKSMPRTTRTLDSPPPDSLDTLEPSALIEQVRSLLAAAQGLSSRLAALNEVAVAVQSSLDADEILLVLTRQARWILDFQYCTIALCDSAAYHIQVLQGDPAAIQGGLHHLRHTGAIGGALNRGHALLLHNLSEVDAPAGMRSALIVPLRSGGEIAGTLNFYAHAAQHYTQDDLRIASALAVQVAVMLQNMRLFAAVTYARDELRTVLESIGDAVLVIGVDGRIRLLNSAMRRLLNLPDTDLTNRRVLWLRRAARFHGQLLIPSIALRALKAVWRAQPVAGASGSAQLNDARYVEWAYAPLVANGIVAGCVLTFRDVSVRMELELLRDDMLHMLVHDLRTPLAGLMMGLDILTLPIEHIGPEERAELLERTRSSARHLLDQVNAILDVRKLEAGRLELDREPASIMLLIDQALTGLLPLAQHAEQVILQEIAPDLPLIALDKRLFRRVIENIVGNALKFTPRGGRIVIGARLEHANCLSIWVQDNGPGIPEELWALIFEKYGQAPGQARRQGTGLGLAFCKLVVEAHGGQIGVERAPDGGSIFWLHIPTTAI